MTFKSDNMLSICKFKKVINYCFIKLNLFSFRWVQII